MLFRAVAADEIAFAMSLFVSAADRAFVAGDSHAISKHRDASEGKRLFLSLSILPMESVDGPKQSALLSTSLYRAFEFLWEHYRGDERRASICARVLGFCYLMEKTHGAIASPWATADSAKPQEVFLHPGLIQAIAATTLSKRGTMSQTVFIADIERFTAETADVAVMSDVAEAARATHLQSLWPAGTGEMAALTRAYHWPQSPLGSSELWPQSLRTAVELALGCSFPMIVLWGADLIQFYNDAYRDIMGVKHPGGLGQPTRECWPEVWQFNEPVYRRILAGETLTFEDQLFPITRYGYLEQAYFTLCYSPIRLESDVISGVLVTVFETTARVRAGVSHAEQRSSEESTKKGPEVTM